MASYEQWVQAMQRILAPALERLEDAPAERVEDGWQGQLYGACPVQGQGDVDGFHWYFRARHDAWSFEVYSTPFEADGGLPPDHTRVWDVEGEAGDASWMPYSEAWQRIAESITSFRRRSHG